jgi:hypothetical protein
MVEEQTTAGKQTGKEYFLEKYKDSTAESTQGDLDELDEEELDKLTVEPDDEEEELEDDEDDEDEDEFLDQFLAENQGGDDAPK